MVGEARDLVKWHELAWTGQGAAVTENVPGPRRQENRRTNTKQGSYSTTPRDWFQGWHVEVCR